MDTAHGCYVMHWPGLLVLFPIASQHAASWQDMQQGGALPLALPGGTAPVASRLCIHAGNAGKPICLLCCAVLCCACLSVCTHGQGACCMHLLSCTDYAVPSNSFMTSELHGHCACCFTCCLGSCITYLHCCLFCMVLGVLSCL